MGGRSLVADPTLGSRSPTSLRGAPAFCMHNAAACHDVPCRGACGSLKTELVPGKDDEARHGHCHSRTAFRGGRLSKMAKILREHGQGELHAPVAVRRMKGRSPWGSLTLRVATLGKAGPPVLGIAQCLLPLQHGSEQHASSRSGHPQFFPLTIPILAEPCTYCWRPP